MFYKVNSNCCDIAFIKYIFIMICAVILIGAVVSGAAGGHVLHSIEKGLAGCIGLYLVMSIGASLKK